MGALLGERGGVKEGSGDGHLFPWGPTREPGKGLIYQGLLRDG